MPLNRYSGNPLITRRDISLSGTHLTDVSSVFNPGGILFNGKIILLLRVQNRGRETFLVKAESSDGKSFQIGTSQITFEGLESIQETVYHCYDPRITRIADVFYIMFAMDLESSCKLGLATTIDFETYSFLKRTTETVSYFRRCSMVNSCVWIDRIHPNRKVDHFLEIRSGCLNQRTYCPGKKFNLCSLDDIITGMNLLVLVLRR